MADIICRWRNATPKTMVELVNSLPHNKMKSNDFRAYMANKWNGDFFRTPYQLACQLGLYCEAEDGFYYPRFDHDINENEALIYLESWIFKYYIPNPYIKSDGFPNLSQPTLVVKALYKYVLEHPICTYEEAYFEVFHEKTKNNDDIVRNLINNYSIVLSFDKDGVLTTNEFDSVLISQFMDINNKKDFFDNFNVVTKINRYQIYLKADLDTRKIMFREYLQKLVKSTSSINQYVNNLSNNAEIQKTVKNLFDVESIYMIIDKDKIQEIFDIVVALPDNLKHDHVYSASVSNYLKFIEYLIQTAELNSSIYKTDQPLQQIFYGAPGTGKSHTIETETKGKEVIRVTFHPDSDYSTFVGAYKPTTVEVPVRDVTGKVIKDNGEEVRESRVVYKFVPQAFLKAYVNAWQNLTKPVYLVIEEINRGNCAQIFGDIFQLLDRSENGYSSYEIDPDKDIQSFLAKEFAKAVDGSASDKIKSGEKMMLPPNLYIWATMNTSDQSLFPIDSAFKRRWDWRYMPIDEEKENWTIFVNGKSYSWSSFLNKINEEIYKTTSSEDKMLGFYFCKAEEKKITAERFVSKVLFYIYNDVFKDYGLDSREFFKDKEDANNVITFQSLYDSKTQKIDEKRVEKLLTNLTVEVLQNSSQQLEANKVEMADD